MNRFLFCAALTATTFLAAPLMAGPVERACLSTERPAASQSLCGCVQNAANVTLSRSDQRQAAKLFREPHRAQEIRQSDRSGHEAFWARYKQFASTAQRVCS